MPAKIMRWRIDPNCLNLSKVHAEMSRSQRRRPSAFSYETFATASFDVVMAEEGVREDTDAIIHAATQVNIVHLHVSYA